MITTTGDLEKIRLRAAKNELTIQEAQEAIGDVTLQTTNMELDWLERADLFQFCADISKWIHYRS